MCEQCGNTSHTPMTPQQVKELQARLGLFSVNGEPVVFEIEPKENETPSE